MIVLDDEIKKMVYYFHYKGVGGKYSPTDTKNVIKIMVDYRSRKEKNNIKNIYLRYLPPDFQSFSVDSFQDQNNNKLDFDFKDHVFHEDKSMYLKYKIRAGTDTRARPAIAIS